MERRPDPLAYTPSTLIVSAPVPVCDIRRLLVSAVNLGALCTCLFVGVYSVELLRTLSRYM